MGDSHYAGTYGQELDRLLTQAGNTVESYGCVSAQASWYVNPAQTCKESQGSTISGEKKDYSSPNINKLIDDFKPQTIIISLGGNIQAAIPSKEARVNQISELVTAIKSRNIPCIWVGPPGKNDPAEATTRDLFYEHLKEGVGTSCILIDSRPLVKLTKKEIHFSDSASPKDWAKKVFAQLSLSSEFVGPPISAMPETEEEKKAYQDFETETPIVEDASIPEETTAVGLVASGKGSASVSQFPTQFLCDDQQRCQNIDEVWLKKIGIYITPEHADKIWDPPTTSWKTFQEVYAPPPPSSQTSLPSIPSTTILPIDESSLSKKIQQEKAAGKYDDAFLAKVNQIAKNLNTKPEYLIAVMRFETGGTFNPSLKSKWSSATGLIQFLSSTAKSLGTSTDQLRTMTQLQQLEYVEKYFNWFKHKIRPNNLGDIAMAVFWPRAIGKEDTYVLFKQDTGAYNANKALDRDKNGEITRAEYLNLFIKRM